jgi:DNA-binding transcriptional regulator YdaS (Cro superfamily)
MNPRQVVDHFGTQTATADALGIAQSSVAGWIDAGEVPEPRQYQIELATGGMLRADKPALRINKAKSAA